MAARCSRIIAAEIKGGCWPKAPFCARESANERWPLISLAAVPLIRGNLRSLFSRFFFLSFCETRSVDVDERLTFIARLYDIRNSIFCHVRLRTILRSVELNLVFSPVHSCVSNSFLSCFQQQFSRQISVLRLAGTITRGTIYATITCEITINEVHAISIFIHSLVPRPRIRPCPADLYIRTHFHAHARTAAYATGS